MSSTAAPDGPPTRSPEPLWRLVQYKAIQAFNREERDFRCWPLFQAASDDQSHCWMVVGLTDGHRAFPAAKDRCRLRIDETWFEATRVDNPQGVTSIQAEKTEHRTFATYRVKVPGKQPPWEPLEMAKDPEDGALKPIFSSKKMRWASIRLEIKSTPQLDDQIERKAVPDASWKFDDPRHYYDIFRWGTEEEFEFEAASVRAFNRQSVYSCWLILCDTIDVEPRRLRSKGVTCQQCLVILAVPDLQEEFPRVGDLCDLGFARNMPPLAKGGDTTKDNDKLKRRAVKYLGGTRLDNPSEKFDLDDASLVGSSWPSYNTFKVSIYKESADDYSPLDDFACKLDWSTLSRCEGRHKPRITLDESSAFKAHVWLRISTTTFNTEMGALNKAMAQPLDSRIGKAFSYIRGFDRPAEGFNLLQAFPHMGIDRMQPEALTELFQRLDEDQQHVYRTVLSNLPGRVGLIPAGPGTGKTTLMLAIAALALSTHGETTCGPILLILEANRPANSAATRVVEHFEELGRTDLRILRAYNFNYEGIWGARRYLKSDDSDSTSSGVPFDEFFQTQRPDHVPQLRRGNKGECRAPNLKEAAQQFLKNHLDEFPLMTALLSADHPDGVASDEGLNDHDVRKEWDELFSRVLAKTDFVITTPVGAAKIAPFFNPKLVLFDEAARARELGTLVALSFSSAEAWLFTGTVEMTKPYLASNGSQTWNPCADQLRTSMMERYAVQVPDTHRLSLNHQAYGNLHSLSSDLFWAGRINSGVPEDERFPPSTVHLLGYLKNLSGDQTMTIPRICVHVKSLKSRRAVDLKQRSKTNRGHLDWVINRVIRDLAQDPEFCATDGSPGSILVTTPYRSQFTQYRKSINGLLSELDREHRVSGSQGERLHRKVHVQAMTADTVSSSHADLVVFDLVTSDMTSHVTDPNRLCAGLTRARQAEIIVMERSMLWREGPAQGRFGRIWPHVRWLHEHCSSRGQVVVVDPVADSQVKRGYSLHSVEPNPVLDRSAVPRQLPALPPTLDLVPDEETAGEALAAAATDGTASEGKGDLDDVEEMFGVSGKFGFEMVRKAMERLKISE